MTVVALEKKEKEKRGELNRHHSPICINVGIFFLPLFKTGDTQLVFCFSMSPKEGNDIQTTPANK